jgi:hypothetical protein
MRITRSDQDARLVVGSGTGKFLKGAGQGIGHAIGGGKYALVVYKSNELSLFDSLNRRSIPFQSRVVHCRLERESEKESRKETERPYSMVSLKVLHRQGVD